MSEELPEISGNTGDENQNGEVPERPRQHRHLHHHRHHRSSSGPRHDPAKKDETALPEPGKPGRRKFRIEQQSREDQWRKIESRLSKHFLKIIGIVFLLNASWFLADSSEYFRYFIYYVVNVILHFGKVLDTTGTGPDISLTFQPLFVVFLLIAIVIFLLFRLAVKRRSFELEIIAYSAWLLHSIWWIINFVWSSNIYYLVGYLFVSTMFFLLVSAANINGYFPRHRQWKRLVETLLILVNSFYYFLSGILALKFLGLGAYKIVFSILIVAWSVGIISRSMKKSRVGSRMPFMAATAVIASLIFPMIVNVNLPIQFLSILSVFFLVISSITRHQTSILFSAVLMLLVLLVYIFQWSFMYLPVSIVPGIKPDKDLFFNGILSGLTLITTFSINYRILKKLTVSPSFKLVNRSTYRKVIKGVLLGLFYLTGFWLFYSVTRYFLPIDGLTLLIVSTFNSIYFIAMIPYLKKTRSSYLRFFLYGAGVTSLVFPALVHGINVSFRTSFLQDKLSLFSGFGFHYLTVIMLIVLLFLMQGYKTKVFFKKKNIIRGFWVYTYLMSSFIAITEFTHLYYLVSGQFTGYVVDSLSKMRNFMDSLIIMLVTICFLVVGFIRRFRFLRVFTLLMMVCVLCKILILDLQSLDFRVKVIFFFILGGTALGISIYYQRLKRWLFSRSDKDYQEQ